MIFGLLGNQFISLFFFLAHCALSAFHKVNSHPPLFFHDENILLLLRAVGNYYVILLSICKFFIKLLYTLDNFPLKTLKVAM